MFAKEEGGLHVRLLFQEIGTVEIIVIDCQSPFFLSMSMGASPVSFGFSLMVF